MLLFCQFARLPNQSSLLTLDQLQKHRSPASLSFTSCYCPSPQKKAGHFGGLFFSMGKAVFEKIGDDVT